MTGIITIVLGGLFLLPAWIVDMVADGLETSAEHAFRDCEQNGSTSCWEEARDEEESAEITRNISTGLYWGAGGMIVLGIGFIVLDYALDRPSSATAGVWIGNDSAAVGVSIPF